ncbi:MAG: hypothetical protein GAK30_00684 [Paracidovorax wautersii]|uniref:diguanylate cyclase n=1 Tax=Paracidovorax wautersii TaxID=1177982 RepID=A0A7V8FRE8_9BURK|nr:MAG: hypothetical protein GAK30_00684 [Paracidovorax wautersii]
MVLLPSASAEAARAVMERIRLAIAALEIQYEGQHLSVTISAGVAVQKSGEDYVATVNRADAALLRAKRRGRNCWDIEP